MTVSPFPQTVVAVVWDFDKTLIPDYMQKPLFARFGIDEGEFWSEVQGLPAFYKGLGSPLISADTMYLNHILTYVRAGKFSGLSNAMLRELGSELDFYPGVPDVFARLRAVIEKSERFQKHGITLEHYVVSTGLRQIILGSPVADSIEEVWACEFLEENASPGYLGSDPPTAPETPEIKDIAYSIDNTTKTRAVFEINKGVNKHPEISVNQKMPEDARRIPFRNMIYVADGPSDVPVFSVVNRFGGKTLGVYKPTSIKEFRQVATLQEQGRIQSSGPADYSESTQTSMWLELSVDQIAAEISSRREQALHDSVGSAPGHIVEPPKDEAPPDAPGQTITPESQED